MKNLWLGFCVVLVCASVATAQSWRVDRAQLCFQRYEDNGVMNILQSWIRIAHYELPMIGGQAVCLYVEAGSQELVVTSTIPYDPHSTDDESCKSKTLKFDLKPGEDRTFTIEPASKGSTYICGWRIKRTPISRRKAKVR